MENKINIAELLKDCPKGMELDCTVYNNVTLEYVCKSNSLPICIRIQNRGTMFLSRYGQFHDEDCCKCVIFPKGKTTWEGFQRPFKDGDILAYTSSYTTVFIYRNKDNEPKYTTSFYVGYTIGAGYPYFHIYNKSTLIALNGDCDVRLATEEEKQKLFDAIKYNGYKWHAETKTLERLIKPKFKVGDKVRVKNGVSEFRIIEDVCDKFYALVPIGKIDFTDQDNWELVPSKFDINTLKPFESKVLVRDSKKFSWRPALYGGVDYQSLCPFITVGGMMYKCMIPYEGNEHLLGTTNDCDKFYKSWK